MSLTVAVYLLLNVYLCESARILAVFPSPSISHQVVFRPLTQELARRGHEVIVITTDPAFPKGKTPTNLTEIDVHDPSYQIWADSFYKHATGKTDDSMLQLHVLLETIGVVFAEQLKNKEVQKIIDEKQHFDLLILEAWVRPTLVLSHIFKAPVIQMSSLGHVFSDYHTIGTPTHPFLYPKVHAIRLYNLTLWEKAKRLYQEYLVSNLVSNFEKRYDDWARQYFGETMPSLEALSDNVGLLFLNVHPIWENNQPVPPSVIYNWGMHQVPEKDIPKDLKSYLDSSPNGVIYFSFGTNTAPSNLPPDTIQMFVRVFSQLPFNVLWKWDKEVLPGKTDNIRINKWFPQADLLRHPKVKLFITQGGLQSTDEALAAGVPLIGIPMLGDQWYNTEQYPHHKVGLKLDLNTLTEEEFKDAINTVIGDESYRQNSKRLGSMLRDQPMPPIERAVWWTEHVLRHSGAAHIRARAANISWAQYLELELCLVIFSLFSVVVLIVYKVLSFIARYCFVSSKLKTN